MTIPCDIRDLVDKIEADVLPPVDWIQRLPCVVDKVIVHLKNFESTKTNARIDVFNLADEAAQQTWEGFVLFSKLHP